MAPIEDADKSWRHPAPPVICGLSAVQVGGVGHDWTLCVAHECRRTVYQLPSWGDFAVISKRLAGLAGAPGFEPGDGGIKIHCLTTWLRPNAVDHSGAHPPDQRPKLGFIHMTCGGALTRPRPPLD